MTKLGAKLSSSKIGEGMLVLANVLPARGLMALAWFVGLQSEHHVVPDAVAEAAESSLSRFLRGGLGMFVDSLLRQ